METNNTNPAGNTAGTSNNSGNTNSGGASASNTVGPTVETTNNTSTPPIPVVDNNRYLCKLQCSIRRKPNLIGIPGQNPNERIYKIGASLDSRTGKNRKGITGIIEKRYMPSIVRVSPNEANFQTALDEYWSGIDKVVPADEEYFKEYEKGLVLNIQFNVIGKAKKERFDQLLTVKDKMDCLNRYLETPQKADEPEKGYMADLLDESISDYLLLAYCLVYPKVANNADDINKSPKIDFYIFERAVAAKTHLNTIDLRNKAMQLYQSLTDDANKINAVLLMFGDNPKNYDSDLDKLLRIDELYNKAPLSNMENFVKFVEDEGWQDKYLINLCVSNGVVRKAPNTSTYYYGDTLLGLSLSEAVQFINNNDKGKVIKQSLVQQSKR